MKRVLFLCSANYYRSRFAEHVFNWLARKEGLAWQADSCGLAADQWGNIGPISRYTVEGLAERCIPCEDPPRQPKHVTLADLRGADLVVAVKEAEHRAMVAAQFPQWVDRVEYWQIDDLDCAEPVDSLPVLERKIRDLVDRLRVEAEQQAA